MKDATGLDNVGTDVVVVELVVVLVVAVDVVVVVGLVVVVVVGGVEVVVVGVVDVEVVVCDGLDGDSLQAATIASAAAIMNPDT